MNKISIILPIYNEEKSIQELFEALRTALDGRVYEVLAVNDGSKDNSFLELKRLAEKDDKIKVIGFKRNFGQTAAISAGIKYASGDILVLIDSDLENDPFDIPKLVDKLNEGYDVVSGWRKNRWKGQFLRRKLPSLMANGLISWVSGVHLHDYGCTLKAYKKDILEEVQLYGQMHRFIPVYCKWQGGKVTELPVSYKKRKYGKSNYGIGRTYRVILDLLLIKFMDKFLHRPIHFFGGIGFLSFVVTLLSAALAVYYKLTNQKDFVETPLPVISSVFFIVGILMILIGIVAEILMRTYFESQNKQPFIVNEIINLNKNE